MRSGFTAQERSRRTNALLAGALFACLSCSRTGSAQPVEIAGIGVTRCHDFIQQVGRDPAVEGDYFAWAQGFMSGVLLRGRPGQDESLKLVPSQLPPEQQRQFLLDYCKHNPLRYYFHATAALYQRLGGTSLLFLL
jgi:hypothetical protein